MKIALIGAGALGSLYGFALSKCNDLTFVDASPAVVDAINENGVTITEPDGTSSTRKIPAVLSGTLTEPVDLAVVLVKCLYTDSAIRANAKAIGPDTTVLTLQNGAGNDAVIAKYAPSRNIVVGTSRHNCVALGPGKTSHSGCGATTVGSKEGAADRVAVVASAFEGSGLELVQSDDIQRIIWAKLFTNLSVNSLSALLDCRIGFMTENSYAWDYAKKIVYEAIMVAEACGTYFDRREALESVRLCCDRNPNGYASMCQDRRRHRLTEIDFINGAVVNEAKQHGVPTPFNQLIVDLMHAVEGTYNDKPREAR